MPPETTTSAAAAAPNVIHNIGYRHYDGPRLGRAYARRSLFSQSVRGSYGLGRSAKSKVLPMLLFGVMSLTAGILVAVTMFTHAKSLPVEYTRFAIYLQAVIALYLAAQAPQSVSRDLRFKTVPLYFSRPIERSDYVAAKFAAMAGALFILTSVPLLILYAGALLAKLDFLDQTKGLAQGLVCVALLSLLFGGIGLVVSALTPRRGFGVAAVIAVLTVPYGAVSAIQGIAFVQGKEAAVGWLGLFSPVTLIDGVQSAFLGGTSSFPNGLAPSTAAGFVYLLVTLGVIAGCYALLSLRYRKAGL
ncbi:MULTISPECIES: ABC transporter permease subunit [Streptomyces]|uniref:ABC transporter permease n=1 Tax=Streptomyces kasugaensis TaxID=1946 RepID=A0A4Q9HP68_STRKA|nr:ABC transporter permease subunit [Streptomyces kasugaensis]TBO56667.1 ABC transporter permease [Streptomyces kasugaensis]